MLSRPNSRNKFVFEPALLARSESSSAPELLIVLKQRADVMNLIIACFVYYQPEAWRARLDAFP